MAKKADLMGLGMSVFLAERIAQEPVVVTAQGAALGSAYAIGGKSYVICVTGSNGGQGVKLPNAGGDTGCLLGDEFSIYNISTDGAVTVYASNSATIAASATNIAGATGITIATHVGATFRMITASQWVGVKGA